MKQQLVVKPEIRAKLGDVCNQIECSLGLLGNSPLTEEQKFHVCQLEQVLCVEVPLLEDEP